MGRKSCPVSLSGRSRGLVLWPIKVEDGKLRFVLTFDIGIGVIIPASVKAPNLSFDLEYRSDITTRVLESS
jgi:hypothetical protein